MLSRALVIVIFVPLLILIFLKGDFTFLIFTEVIIGMSVYEFYKMLKDKGFEVASRIGLFLSLLLPVLVYMKDKVLFSYNFMGFSGDIIARFDIGGFVVFALMLIATRQILKVKINGAMAEISYTLFGIIYISYFFSYILLIKSEFSNGRALVLMTFILIWTCDIGAFIVALKFDVIFSFFAEFFCKNIHIFSECSVHSNISFTKTEALLLALIIAFFAELGDLVESKIKREFEIKDSGTLLLGHGGFLDRFDSALFVLPVVYYFVKYFIS